MVFEDIILDGKMNLEILEAALLSILLLTILIDNSLTNHLMLFALVILVIIFWIFSILKLLNLVNVGRVRLFLLLAIIAVLYSSWLFKNINMRYITGNANIHDGAILTEAATAAILSGKNPYSISFDDAFGDVSNKPISVAYGTFMYSPLMFLANVPFSLLEEAIVQISDLRIALVILLIACVVIAGLISNWNLLFLTIFSLNPIFIPLTFYGANEIVVLLAVFLVILFLKLGKINWATAALVFASATKILILPLVPIYFLYLARIQKTFWYKQLAYFVLGTFLIYLPFVLWSPQDFIHDVVLYHLRGGAESHLIAGFAGLPQILLRLGLIGQNSDFPFFIIQVGLGVGALIYVKKIFVKWPDLSVFILLFSFYFLLLLSFSRIIQTSYLGFISQILLLGSFLKIERDLGQK